MFCHPPVRTRFATVLMAELLLLAGAMHVPTAVATEPQVEVTQLLKTTHSWDGVQYRTYPDGQPEVSVLRYKIPAHSALPWHTHPVINVAYVLSGHLTVIRKSDGKTMVIGPGDVLPEIVDAPHRGQSGDEPVELIVFYAGTPTVALTVKSEPN
ncbi:quercetin dioxygenase-like cupin family protein [Pseudomonas baetica]|uniref:Quercetin dioxygenase-like cupin family protein n=2 Tax=Pseudomonas baetica TaxID=674054 RepID=A0ABX4Q2X8_9PSED|nr:quercetin dioxygenase-like cupin family protein [Pseudomonas baetica]PTC19637.1 cupin [Pseudomonas baetica]